MFVGTTRWASIRVAACCVVFLAAYSAHAADADYLIRIAHETYENTSCALLRGDGTFHLEVSSGDNTKVFEGSTTADEVKRIQKIVDSSPISGLAQRQILEPLARDRWEKLQLTINRGDYSQDLFFQSTESEQPYQDSLQPLIRWLNDLHKLPHKELSEDEGKQNCLPPRDIVLKRRDPNPPATASPAPKSAATKTLNMPSLASLSPARLGSITPLLRVYSFSASGGERQFCLLVTTEGSYRYEDHARKNAKAVNKLILGGRLSAVELADLRSKLDARDLARIKHREPPGTRAVPILGDMMTISIARDSGVQEFMLSSSYGRTFGSFYGGDADTSVARDLTRFVREHIESNKAGVLDNSAQNDCTDAP